jgi:hypothetical protein
MGVFGRNPACSVQEGLNIYLTKLWQGGKRPAADKASLPMRKILIADFHQA